MLRHKGTRELKTPRLTLRRFTVEDAEAMYNNWASDPEVTRYVTWSPHESAEATRQLLTVWTEAYENDDRYHWVITKDGEPIGDVCLAKISESNYSAELGYCLSRRFWGQGIMTEAVARVVKELRDIGFHRLEIRNLTVNPASGRVAEKNGFSFEGVSREALCKDGRFYDIAHWGLLL